MALRRVVQGSVLTVLLALLISFVPPLLQKPLPPGGAAGFAAPGWRKVADVFRKNLDSGVEAGASMAVYHRGHLVAEFSGGYADSEAEVPWSRDTLCQIFSSSKGVAAVTMAVLVDRGLLDYKQRVAAYWPEFSQNGKGYITVEQLFSHQAGLAVIDTPFAETDMLSDPDKVAAILAAQPPNWTPGSEIGYHGHTLGLYMDQLVRRVDPSHRDLPTFFHQEIAQPFDLEVFFGLPRAENDRVARVYDLSLLSLQPLFAPRYWPVIWTFVTQPDSLTSRSIVNPISGSPNNPTFQDVWNPSTHAFGTAVSLAKLFGIVANGGSHNGRKLLSPKMAAQLTEILKTGNDVILKMELSYGRGTTVRETPLGSRALGTPGAGGQMVYADPEHQVAWTYITNHLSVFAIGDDPRYLALEKAIYDSLEKLEAKGRRHGA